MASTKIENATYPELDNNKLEAKYKIKRIDTPHGRAYYDKDAANETERAYFYGVTSILQTLAKGIGYDMWLGNSLSHEHAMEYALNKADIGTAVHVLTEYLQWGQVVDCDTGFYNSRTNKIDEITPGMKKMLQAYIDFYNDYRPVQIATELSLYNPEIFKNEFGEGHKYPFAGTADSICTMPPKKEGGQPRLALIDLKTGKQYKSHQLQLTAYKLLFDGLYGEEHGEIDDLYCLYVTSRGKYTLKQYKFVPEVWYNLLEIFFWNIQDGRGRQPVIKEKQELPRYYALDEEQLKEKEEKKEDVGE
tara:strand:- start:77 stop:988 length:912 start_codon:yes stop_codon:yes gene_type:complete